MKAIIYTRYGAPADVLQFTDVEKPSPKDDEVLVKVHASSINAAQSLLINGESFLTRMIAGGRRKPKNPIPGADIAGVVEAVGAKVTQFKPGDAVFGELSGGAYAEYACAKEKLLALKPASLTFEAAAAVPLAGVTALQGLRDSAKVQAGQTVLITGASGGVGMFAVQLAKVFGAQVTAVASTAKIGAVRAIGADHVIDYKKEDVTRSGKQYDLILDMAAYRPFLDYRQTLRPDGKYLLGGGSLGRIFRAMLIGRLVSIFSRRKFGNFAASANAKDLEFLSELLEAGKIKPVIDRCYPLNEAAAALTYYESGHAAGKIIITMTEVPA